MLPCNSCGRHIRAEESSCPFCGGVQRRESSPLRALVAVLGVSVALLGSVGCTPDEVDLPQAGSTTDPSGTSETTLDTSADTSTSTSTSSDGTEDTTDPQTNTSGGFYAGPEVDMGTPNNCDPWAQDCPEGEKCVPYGEGATWDANKCVGLMGDGQPGDPCVSGGITDASDDCNAQTVCFNAVENEDGILVGECLPFCVGSPDAPGCEDEGQTCVVTNENSINLCFNRCDPLLQDCPAETEACYWLEGDFACAYIFSTEEDGSCFSLNSCPGGQICMDSEQLPSCEFDFCCADYCDVQDPEACPEEGVECVSFLGDPTPPGLEQYVDVGVCIVPPP